MKTYISAFVLSMLFVMTISAQAKDFQKLVKRDSVTCDSYSEQFNILAYVLQNSTGVKGYIIVYEGKLKEKRYENDKFVGFAEFSPTKGSTKATIKAIKQRFYALRIRSARLVFIKGFRDYFGVEFWIVPNGAKTPKASLAVKKIQYQKGKPKAFCN